MAVSIVFAICLVVFIPEADEIPHGEAVMSRHKVHGRPRFPASLVDAAGFVSITRAPGDLSVVARQEVELGADAPCERGWTALRVDGPLDFSLVGILANLTAALAEAGVSVFVISTYDTDILLVRTDSLDDAVAALNHRGHSVSRPV